MDSLSIVIASLIIPSANKNFSSAFSSAEKPLSCESTLLLAFSTFSSVSFWVFAFARISLPACTSLSFPFSLQVYVNHTLNELVAHWTIFLYQGCKYCEHIYSVVQIFLVSWSQSVFHQTIVLVRRYRCFCLIGFFPFEFWRERNLLITSDKSVNFLLPSVSSISKTFSQNPSIFFKFPFF